MVVFINIFLEIFNLTNVSWFFLKNGFDVKFWFFVIRHKPTLLWLLIIHTRKTINIFFVPNHPKVFPFPFAVRVNNASSVCLLAFPVNVFILLSPIMHSRNILSTHVRNISINVDYVSNSNIVVGSGFFFTSCGNTSVRRF